MRTRAIYHCQSCHALAGELHEEGCPNASSAEQRYPTSTVTSDVTNAVPKPLPGLAARVGAESVASEVEKASAAPFDHVPGAAGMRPNAAGNSHGPSRRAGSDPGTGSPGASDQCPECRGHGGVHHPDCPLREASNPVNIPLGHQIDLFEARRWSVLQQMRGDLEDPEFVDRLMRVARDRLINGEDLYGSRMYGWGFDEREQNKLEEAADWLVYGTSEDSF